MEYFLKQVAPGNPYPLLISLHEDEMKIGRSTVTSLSRYNRVSRYHASFTKRDCSWYITDLKSLNCLYVNLERVQHTVQVNIGDIIGFGSPNVSEDGGFVCVLAARSKITVKQEPLDEDYCVEIINDPINNVKKCTSGQQIHKKTNDSEVDSTLKNFPSISSSTIICTSDSTLDVQQKTVANPDVKALTVQTILDLPKLVTKNKDNLNSSTELNTVATTREVVRGNPVLKTRATNVKVEYDTESNSEISSYHNNLNCLPTTHTNTKSSPSNTYPGIEYFTGLEEDRPCGNIVSDVIAKDMASENNSSALSYSTIVMVPKEKSCFNSTNVKQECLNDFEANLSVKIQQKKILVQEVGKFQNCERINDDIVKQCIIKKEGLPKACSASTFNKTYGINPANDMGKEELKLKFDCISAPSQNLNNPYDTTNKVTVDNVVSSHDSFHSSQNFENGNYHFKSYSEGDIEHSEAFLANENKLHSEKQKCDKLNVNSEGNVAKPTIVNSSPNQKYKKYSRNDSLFPKMTLNCNVASVKCGLENTEIYANVEKTNCPRILGSNKGQQEKKSSDLLSVNNHNKKSSKFKNTTSKTKRNNLTVAINLKVKKNKILNSESDCERKEEQLSTPPNSSATYSRRPKRKRENHHKDKCDSQQNKSKKIKEKNNVKVSHSVHSKRLNSLSDYSDENYRTRPSSEKVKSNENFRNARSKSVSTTHYSDEYYRTRPSSEKSNERSRNTKSKSVGKTLLIDSKPMEYRPRTLRGREEWFQERTVVSDVKHCSQNLKRRSSCHTELFSKQASSKSYEMLDAETENSKRRKLKGCCQKRKEKERLKNQRKESEYLFQKSKEVHCRVEIEKHQKIPTRDSQKSTKLDSVSKKIVKPPVPRRKNDSTSRMGFLLDATINCDKKSVNKDKEEQQKKKKQELAKMQENIASESKIHLDLSLKVDISENKLRKPNQRSKSVVQHNYTKTSTLCESYSLAAEHSIPNTKKYPEMDINEVRESEKWIPISESNSTRTYVYQNKTYEEICKPDKYLNSNKFKKTTKESQSKDISYSTNSEKAVIFSPSHYSIEDSTDYRHSTRIVEHFNASSTLLIEMIVSWNPKWLIEQVNNKNPPPLITQGASLLNLSFSSYESYAASYFSMIVLETWESIFKECSQHLLLDQLQNCINFCYVVKTWENRRELTELKCETVVSDVLCYCPMEGNILLLNMKDRLESGIENYRFGCIRRHSIETFKRGPSEWNYIPVEALNNAKLVKFEVLIKKSKRPVSFKSVCLAYGLSNVKPYLQLADALRSLQNSPLCQDICHPREDTLKFCDSSSQTFSSDNLVKAIIEEIKNSHSKANILLLQAPSGTGKTRCVVELVKKLIFKHSTKSKVLLCTPSYTALDEILHGIIRSNDECSNLSSTNSMKIIRIGECEATDSNLMEYSLTKKVENLYRVDCVKKMHTRENALKILEGKINDILFKQEKRHDIYSKVNKSTTLKAFIDKMDIMKSKNLLHPMDDGCRKGYECIILQESDVLVTTLECSMLPAVRTFLKNDLSVYCIVDEAAQCNELQLLQCLHHEKIKKIILFGDPQQQKPMVHSKYAAKCGFDRSIFERFLFHYRKKFNKIPCPVLKKQYRMHSEICQFPSKYFYNQELSTARGVDESYSNFPLKPYIVLDVLDSGSISVDTESSLIMYICSLLVQTCPAATIGVIVTGEENKPRISLPWDPEYRLVELNNLEGFHGKEKDIVLIPCIQKSTMLDGESLISCSKMLNTAITRAKQCLIICGQIASKVEYPHWRDLMDDAISRNCYLCVASLSHVPLVFANYIKKM